MDVIKVFCPGSVANISCGFDVLGLALERPGDFMTIQKIDEPTVRMVHLDHYNLPLEPEKNVAGKAALEIISDLNLKHGFEIIIEKKIHPGSGIGSSSASASGVVFAINELLDKALDEDKLLHYAMVGEYVASGSYHADNVAPALLGGILLIRGYKPLDYVQIPVPKNLYLTVITPQIEIRTYDARRVLKRRVELKDAITQCGNLAGLVAGFYRSDYGLISRSLTDVLIEPQRAALIPSFYELKKTAIEVGALGAGISGSGPSVFAMSEGETVASAVAQAFKEVYEPLNIPYGTVVNKERVSFKEATLRSLAPDRGLYFPEAIPVVDKEVLHGYKSMEKEALCLKVIKPFVGDDIGEEKLRDIISETLNFPTPLNQITPDVYCLELFHGPTLAFKDVGARFMSRCIDHFVGDSEQRKTILVATSGDTGGAVANGFFGSSKVKVIILYPKAKVSPLQEKQLTTLGGNVTAMEIDGSFDDCQNLVKSAFVDTEINE
ncbi:unnamed protein product, partial [Cyprideis torosa]